MKKLLGICLWSILFVTPSLSQIEFAVGGNLYLAPQYWSKVGDSKDPKFGVGFGALVGLGITDSIDKIIFGPHFAVSRWEADYSKKENSATSSVYVEMVETGLGFLAIFDEMYLSAATGKATINSGMIVDKQDIKYPYSGNTYTYYHVGLGYKSDMLMFGIGFVSYSNYAKYCNHMEIRIGIGF